MDLITPLASECRVASAHDKVMNSECVYTFHSPYTTDQGILVSLTTFVGTVQELASVATSGKGLFVRIVKQRVVKEKTATADPPSAAAAPTKLAIGVEGGFASDADKYETVSTYSVVLLKREAKDSSLQVLAEVPYTEGNKNEFPTLVTMSVDSILNHAGVLAQQDVQQWQLDEEIPVSKYAENLPFVENGMYPDAERSTENLWLNLSDGFIGGGRKNWDGSGGTGGALDHFKETGRVYPLVVKLGTLTADVATADCYSYAPDEDGPVKIPNLKQLLEKRGIHIASMQKTVKTTAELEVELNANYAFDAITEAGAHLKPLSGPGLQGLQNLGNSCYMNSVLQVLFSGTIPELACRYGTKAGGTVTCHSFINAAHSAPWDDLLCQTTKVACALTSGFFAMPVELAESEEGTTTNPKYRLAPRMFKQVIGKNHVDFCTAHQQDAVQFLQYLLERLDLAESAAAEQSPGLLPTDMANKIHLSSRLFSFKTQSRLVCGADQKVRYSVGASDNVWSLRIPVEKVASAEDTKEEMASPDQKRLKSDDSDKKQVPTISFAACVEEWSKEVTVDGIQWSHLQNQKFPALQRTRFYNFPRYLVVQMQRYQLGPDWTPIKLEVKLDTPEELDLSQYKCCGPQDGDDLVPDVDESVTTPKAGGSEQGIDVVSLAQLMDMGFSMNSCRRALNAVGGSDTEAAMTWILEHNNDVDFNDPLPESTATPAGSARSEQGVNEVVVQSLLESLGCFSADQIRAALLAANGAADQAADWLFSHMDDLDNAIAALKIQEPTRPKEKNTVSSESLEDGEGKFTMIGMISHIGKNTGSGHYVAHLKKNNEWTIFNDEKVALSSKPPIEHAYMYVFQRNDTIGARNQYY